MDVDAVHARLEFRNRGEINLWTTELHRKDIAARINVPNRVYLPVLETRLVFEILLREMVSATGAQGDPDPPSDASLSISSSHEPPMSE